MLDLSIAILAIYIGFSLDGGKISALFELPAFIIVFGGTLGAVMLQSSRLCNLRMQYHYLSGCFSPPQYDVEQGINDIVSWAEKASESQAILSLENIALEVQKIAYTQEGVEFFS